jgi:hypothetical protein
MTRTEDRLADALRTAAHSVREETMRPLEVPTPAERRWVRRLVPAAAAACVALVVVIVTVIVPSIGPAPSTTAAPSGPPPFYIATGYPQLEVRSAVTGAVTGTIPTPRYGSGASGQTLDPVAVTSVGTSGRDFIAAFITTSQGPSLTRLYGFRLTREGHVTGLSLIRGGTLDGLRVLYSYDMAASPDGSKLVLSACGASGISPCGLVAIDLRTGARTLWTGGLGQRTNGINIMDVGWAPGGGSVTFLTSDCSSLLLQCAGAQSRPQLRELSLGTGGGSLAKSSVLLTASAPYSDLLQAQLSNDGRTIIFMDQYGPVTNGAKSIRIVQVPLNGGRPRLLFQLPHVNSFSSLRLSPSGGYLLLNGSRAAWVYRGKLHLVPGRTSLLTWW